MIKLITKKSETQNDLNVVKFKSTVDKSLFSIEKLRKHKILFNRFKYGLLEFFFEITYKDSNVFLCFFCKAENYPSKVFVFFKQSLGLENRDKIRAGLSPKVPMRGRRKSQVPFIRNKFVLLKNYLFEFIKHHPEITAYKLICIIWKLYKFDVNIQNMMNQPFEITYNYKIIERVLKEHMKNEILARVGLREKLDLNSQDLISKFFVKKDSSSDVFLFRKNNKLQIREFKEELVEKFNELQNELQNESMKTRLIEIIKLQLQNSKKSREVNAFDFIKKNVNIIFKTLKNENFNFSKNEYHMIDENKKILNEESIDTENSQINSITTTKFFSINKRLERYENYLEKSIYLNNYIISSYQPAVMHKVIIKFPHNGCRGKKARRLKRSKK